MFLNKVTEGCGAYVAVKQEMMQPTASIKDRYSYEPTNVQISLFLSLKILQLCNLNYFYLQTGICYDH